MLSEKSILESLRSYKDIPCPGVKGHVPVPDYCGKCGYRVFLEDDYCGKCGTLLKWPNEQEFKIMRDNLRENNL